MIPLRHPGPRFPSLAALVVLVALVGPAPALAEDPPPRSAPAARAAYNAAAALQNRGAWDLAAAAWEAMLRDHPRDALAASARYQLGVCRNEEGRRAQALDAFRAAAAAGDAAVATAARFEIGRGMFAEARELGTPEAHRRAAEDLQAFLDLPPARGDTAAAAPKAALRRAEAHALLAEARWQAGDKARAFEAWERFLRDHPASPRAPEVLYALGLARAEEGDRDAAASALRRFSESFPTHALADEVTVRRADLELAAGKPADAARLVVDLAKRSEGPHADEALDRLGTALWRQDRHVAAANAFDLLAERRGATPAASAARLSAAAAWGAAGKTDESRRRLETILGAGADRADAATVAEAAARLARLEIAAGATERALAAAEKGLAGMPADADVATRLRLARAEALAASPGRRQEAIDDVDRLLAADPGEERLAGALALRASLALEAGRPAEALSAADRFLALPADRRAAGETFVRAVRAESLLASGDPAGAAAAYADLVREGEGDRRRPHWRLRMGAALLAAEEWGAAHDALGTLATAAGGASGLEESEVPESLLLDASALVELGRPADALPLLARLERDHAGWPRRPEAMLVGVRARRDSGDVAGARRVAEELVRTTPPDGAAGERAWYSLAVARRDDADPAGAVAAFREARRLDPVGPRVAPGLLAEGWCHQALGDAAAAERAWTEIVERHPDSALLAEALLARADLRLGAGDTTGARADAERVGQVVGAGKAPDTAARARLVTALALAAEGLHGEAAERLGALAVDHPRFEDADRVLLELAIAQSLSGNPAAAEQTLSDLRERHPRSRRVAESWLESGECRFAVADWDGAADAYRKALGAGGPDDGELREEALHRLAWTFSMRRDAARAAEAFRAQLDACPEGPCAADGRVMLGDALFLLGRVDEAAATLAEALADRDRVSSADLVGLATVRAAECEAKRGDFAAGLGRLEAWLPGAVTPDVSPRTRTLGRFARAEAFHGLGRVEDALGEFRALADEALAADGAPGELAARARLMEGEMLFELGRHVEAIAAFFKVAYGFGDRQAPPAFHPWQAQATFEAARCCDVLGKAEQARGLYAELVERHPGSPHVDAARLRLDALGSAARP